MAIPTYDQFVWPLIKLLHEQPEGVRCADAYVALANRLGLDDDERAQFLPSGRQPVYQNRIGWANDRLKRSGYAESPRRGVWRITENGRTALAKYPDGPSDEQLQAIVKVQGPWSEATNTTADIPPGKNDAEARSPSERIDAAVADLNDSLASELLNVILAASPAFFEQLVLDVLAAMGYGASRSAIQRTGSSGDGGIDGIITLDRLGLEKVYVQAKRWQGKVGRPEIQAFFGALAGRRASKGVFITTSAFSREAQDFAEQVSDHIVLVDGRLLTSLMIEYGVGVSNERSIRVGRIDSDYFEEA
ncbi:MAG: restriction endonuclease [Deltaproteobacteria bacterium]|nr:restriction endonuclease [Deltaproteobacteria bacterium]